MFWTVKNCFGWVLIDLVPIVLMGQNYFGPVQIRLINLDLCKTIWICPKQFGSIQIDWNLTKIIGMVKNHFGPIEGQRKQINITHCEGANCFQSDFQIDTSTLNQMQNVIEASTTSSQK